MFELVFYSILSLVAISLFITAFIQGFIMQIVAHDVAGAFTHYLGSFLALVSAAFVVARAKRVITVLSRSDFLEQFLRS